MADSFKAEGKVQAMTGIKAVISEITLNAFATVLSTASVSSLDFAVNASTGQLSNTAAIDFTIGAEDVGSIADAVRINSATGALIFIDLDTTITLTNAGTATIAIGALTADL